MTDNRSQAAVDLFGQLVMRARDRAVVQWDQIVTGKRQYAPWDRLKASSEVTTSVEVAVQRLVPSIIDTAIYVLLAELDASDTVRVIATTPDGKSHDVAEESWSLPAEPAGETGWLTRFSKQRFEQPY